MGRMKEKYISENFPEWDELEYERDRQIIMEKEWEQYEEWKEEEKLRKTKIEIGYARERKINDKRIKRETTRL